MSFYETPICESLKKYMSFRTDQDLNEYFLSITDDGFNWVIKCPWLEPKCYAAMQNFREEWSGQYIAGNKTKPTVFIIPKANQGTDSEASYKEPRNTIPNDTSEEEDYSLAKSIKGKYGQIVPCLAAEDGEVFDGLHRQNIKSDAWTVKVPQIKSAVDKVYGRMIANKVRRRYQAEELTKDIGFLIGMGYTISQMHETTGISERTLYRYMPQQLKKPEAKKISEAMKEKSEVVRKELTAVTSPEVARTLDKIASEVPFKSMQEAIASEITPCEGCGKPVHRSNLKIAGGKLVCPQCRGEKPAVKPEPEVKVFKPKEKAETIVARMHPLISKMDEAMLIRLQNNQRLRELGWKIEFQKVYTKVLCVSDVTLTNEKLGREIALFFDHGETHKGKEFEDEDRRQEAAALHDIAYLPLPYHAYTETECQRLEKLIVERLE